MINKKENDSNVMILSEDYEVSGYLILKDNDVALNVAATDNVGIASGLPSGIYYVLPYLIDSNGMYNYKPQEMFEVA
jgi:hypothetical protein